MATELADAASEAVVSVEHADSAEQTRGRGLVASVFYISAHANQPTHATTNVLFAPLGVLVGRCRLDVFRHFFAVTKQTR